MASTSASTSPLTAFPICLPIHGLTLIGEILVIPQSRYGLLKILTCKCLRRCELRRVIQFKAEQLDDIEIVVRVIAPAYAGERIQE